MPTKEQLEKWLQDAQNKLQALRQLRQSNFGVLRYLDSLYETGIKNNIRRYKEELRKFDEQD